LSPEKRITKRQMKQDKLVSTAFRVSEFVQLQKKFVVAGAGIVVVVALIIYFINYAIARKSQESAELFGKAQLASAMGQSALAKSDYKSVLDQYGSTELAGRACFYYARTFYEENNCDSSLIYFEKYIEDFGKDNLLLRGAYLGAASCLEDRGDYARAGEYYFKAAVLADDEMFAPDYYMASGRAYVSAGAYSEAEKAYQIIVDKYNKSAAFAMARKKLAEVQYKINPAESN